MFLSRYKSEKRTRTITADTLSPPSSPFSRSVFLSSSNPRSLLHVTPVLPPVSGASPPQTGEINMPAAAVGGGKPKLTTENALSYLRKVKDIFKNEKRKYSDFLQLMRDFKSQRIGTEEIIRRVKELFKGHSDLILSFNTFLPKGYEIPPPSTLHDTRNFVNKVKARLQNEEHSYSSFLHILSTCLQKNKPIQEIYHEVSLLLQNHQDLLDEFSRFLPMHVSRACHAPPGTPFSPMVDSCSDEPDVRHRHLQQIRDEKLHVDYDLGVDHLHTEHERKRIRAFSREMDSMHHQKKPSQRAGDTDAGLLHHMGEGHLPMPVKAEGRNTKRLHENNEQNRRKKRERELQKETERLDKSTTFFPKDTEDQSLPSFNEENYGSFKSISELDFSNCQQCTSSYRLLPKNYSPPPPCGRTEHEAAVLNDICVSVASGSEDYSFKNMCKNQYEETLFRIEDDRFELDMEINLVETTTKKIEELLEKIQNGEIKLNNPIHIKDHLTMIHLRCIERLYGDHGLDVIDAVQKNAHLALPIILVRLKQKQDELSRFHSDVNKYWAGIFTMNFHKSLDHHSFCFKQQEVKSLSTKALLAEIKELNEKKQKEDDVFLATALGHRVISPDMEFEFTDSSIHEDIYQIINYYCQEVCSSMDQVDSVWGIWTAFLEPILGIPSRPHGAEDIEDPEETRNSSAKGETYHWDFKCQATHSSYAFCCTPLHGEVHNSDFMGDDIARINGYNGSTEWLANNHILRSGMKQTQEACMTSTRPGCSDAETVPGHQLHKEILPSQGGGNLRPDTSADRVSMNERIRIHRCSEGYPAQENFKFEREEGDLSPDGYFGYTNSASCEKNNGNTLLKVKGCSASRLYPIRTEGEVHSRTAGENVDAYDEGEGSVQTSRDGDNASEAGKDAFCSESGLGEDCSQNNEEEVANHDDHTDKESEDVTDKRIDARDGGGGTPLPLSELFPSTAKPLAVHVPSALHEKEYEGSQIFYGSDSFYVLLRLYQILYERLLSAKVSCASAERKQRILKETNSPDLYPKFMTALYSLINGSADNTKFEENCCAIIGTQSYVLFTLDKLIDKVVKQLQAIASDERDTELIQLYAYENSRRPGRIFDLAYHKNACVIHTDSLYRFECSWKTYCLSIQLMEHGHEKTEVATGSMHPNFVAYLSADNFLTDVPNVEMRAVFLQRNIRKTEGCSTDWIIFNEMVSKISCDFSMAPHVSDKEDRFYRRKRRTCRSVLNCHGSDSSISSVKAHRFHQFQSRFIGMP